MVSYRVEKNHYKHTLDFIFFICSVVEKKAPKLSASFTFIFTRNI